MEKEFTIPIPKTKLQIYTKQYGTLDRPVVVFVHGLTGNMDEHIFYNGARYFNQHGFSSIRFNLYDWPKSARKLTNCTLKTHAHDLDVVVDDLKKKKVQQIFAIGHSYGGPTVLMADHNRLNGLVLWDPTYGNLFKKDKYIAELDAYRIRWGYDVLIGSKMRDEARDLSWDTLAVDTQVPLKVIAAEKGILMSTRKKYVEQARGLTDLAVIKGADHNFNVEGVAEQLFAESEAWFKKYL